LTNLTSPRVTVENYPKESYTADMSTMLRVIIPFSFVIPLAQFINILLILIVTEKESKIKDGLKMIGVSDGAYW
jgi:ATP-binding cassette subfamily A (ABC1) protein 5